MSTFVVELTDETFENLRPFQQYHRHTITRKGKIHRKTILTGFAILLLQFEKCLKVDTGITDIIL